MYSSQLSGAFPALVSTFPRRVVTALFGTAILTLSAKLHVPFWPVPMTMQSFAVLIIAMALGPMFGTGTVFLYLLEGALGLPVFSGTPERGIDLAYMIGPTGGYLVGFLMAAAVVSKLSQLGWGKYFIPSLTAMFIGTFIIFVCGYIWLAHIVGFEKAFELGVLPFLPAAALKIILGAAVMPMVLKLFSKSSGLQ